MTVESGGVFPVEPAKAVRLVILDVDGVLTDGGVYIGGPGAGEGPPLELKRFDIQDGLGVKLLQWAGLEVAVVSGRVSPATTLRASELGIEECHQDTGARKLPIVSDMLERKGIAWGEVAMVADDLPDMPVFTRVGLPVAVANAIPEVKDAALWCTEKDGGHGAVREFCRALLEARGQWHEQVDSYVRSRSAEEEAGIATASGQEASTVEDD